MQKQRRNVRRLPANSGHLQATIPRRIADSRIVAWRCAPLWQVAASCAEDSDTLARVDAVQGAVMRSLFAELRRRNVFRAGVLYVGAVWALAQGIAQLTPVVNAPEWAARWFLVAACIGFPFWIAFAWFYEFTPKGLKRESEVERHHRCEPHWRRRPISGCHGTLSLPSVLHSEDTGFRYCVLASSANSKQTPRGHQ